jgi:hypothetical protein
VVEEGLGLMAWPFDKSLNPDFEKFFQKKEYDKRGAFLDIFDQRVTTSSNVPAEDDVLTLEKMQAAMDTLRYSGGLGHVKRMLARFKVGEPLKTWFNPQLEVREGFESSGVAVLEIRVTTICADSKERKLIPLTIQTPLKVKTLAEMSEQQFHEIVFRHLCDLCRHEVGESVRVDGRKPFDPHKGEIAAVDVL